MSRFLMRTSMMNKWVSCLVAVFSASLLFCATLPAAGPGDGDSSGKNKDRQEWYEKMMAEKIAFFTAEMDLTPAEAEKFWPVYNQLEREQRDLFRKVGDSYFALEKALDGNASEKEIENKFNAYISALKARNNAETSQIARYSGIISREKIARMVVAEEKFRRQQISRLHKTSDDK